MFWLKENDDKSAEHVIYKFRNGKWVLSKDSSVSDDKATLVSPEFGEAGSLIGKHLNEVIMSKEF